MSRWLAGLVVVAACGSKEVATETSPPPAVPVAAVATAPLDDLSAAAAAYERGKKANEDWRFADAVRDLDIAFEIYNKKLPENDARLQDAIGALGRATRAVGDFQRSTQLFQRWIKQARAAGDRAAESQGLNVLGLTLQESGDARTAKRMFELALAIDEELKLPDSDGEKSAHIHNLALALGDLHEFERSAEMLERVLATDRAADPESVNTANTMHNLALTYRDSGHDEKAKPLFEKAIKILTAKLGAKHPRLAPSMSGLAGTLYGLGDYDKAEALYKRVLAIPDLTDDSRAIALGDLGATETELRRGKEAVAHLDEAIGLLEKHYSGADNDELVRALIKRADAHVVAGNNKLAVRDGDAAIAMSTRLNGRSPELVAATIDSVSYIWERVPSEAKRMAELKERARAVREGT